MQQSCQNFVRSSHFPEEGKGILSFTFLREVEGAVVKEAILSELEEPKFNWEKRSRREFGSLGLGSKWKESDKGSLSPIVLVQNTLGISSVFVCLFQGFKIHEIEVKHLFEENTLLLWL